VSKILTQSGLKTSTTSEAFDGNDRTVSEKEKNVVGKIYDRLLSKMQLNANLL